MINKVINTDDLPELLKTLIEAKEVRVRSAAGGIIQIVPVENTDRETETKGGKARHRWTKEISQITFTAKYRGGSGSAVWRKRNELVLLKGAKLSSSPQINRDGSVNFSSQFAEKLRMDHLDKVDKNLITKEDIVFPSPNQWGIFLFYGGQNTWEELKDSSGKSLDDWSRID